MPLWIAMKLLLLQMALGLGVELTTTLRTQTALLMQPGHTAEMKLTLFTAMTETARIYLELFQQVAQRL